MWSKWYCYKLEKGFTSTIIFNKSLLLYDKIQENSKRARNSLKINAEFRLKSSIVNIKYAKIYIIYDVRHSIAAR